MIIESLPDVPRALTGVAEWLACVVYILLRRRRLPRAQFVLLALAALGVQVGAGVVRPVTPGHRGATGAGIIPVRRWRTPAAAPPRR